MPIVQNLLYLISTQPSQWVGAFTFGLIGFWMAYLQWYVSPRRLGALLAQQERFLASNLELRNRLAQRNAQKAKTGDGTGIRKLRGTGKLSEEVDDLTKLSGMTPTAAIRMRASGIKRFTQLAELGEMSQSERDRFCKRFALKGVDFDEWAWIWERGDSGDRDDVSFEEENTPGGESSIPREIDFAGVVDREFPGEEVRQTQMGIIYDAKPMVTDDLSMIQGVGDRVAEKLNDLGFYRFKQIANWTEPNILKISERSICSQERIVAERWIPQARELANIEAAAEMERFTAPADIDQHDAVAADFEGEDVSVDSALGVLYRSKPDVVDELTEVIGIDQKLQDRLNEVGVYRLKQLVYWTNPNVAEFAHKIGIDKGRIEAEKWIPQAAQLQREIYSASSEWGSKHPTLAEYEAKIAADFGRENVKADENLGIVYAGKPSGRDDLQMIDGVGPDFEARLRNLGVHGYQQIACWSAANVKAIAEELSCSTDRIYRERWIKQAKALVS